MLWMLLFVILIAAALYVLRYGYKLAFYYEDPRNSPYGYEENDQTLPCKEVQDAVIAAFEKEPFDGSGRGSSDGIFDTNGRFLRERGSVHEKKREEQ